MNPSPPDFLPASPPASPTKPPEQRPEHPDFWCKRFDEGVTPWDAGGAPAAFARFIARQPAPLNTLIPGCGSAWDAAHLAELGWPVTALDFSPKAVEAARDVLSQVAAQGRAQSTAANLICDCALPRKLWADWGARVAALLPAGGLLAGFFFICDQPKGPPFGILPTELDALLSANFELIEDAAVDDSIPVFSGRERWQVWRRR